MGVQQICDGVEGAVSVSNPQRAPHTDATIKTPSKIEPVNTSSNKKKNDVPASKETKLKNKYSLKGAQLLKINHVELDVDVELNWSALISL